MGAGVGGWGVAEISTIETEEPAARETLIWLPKPAAKV